MITEVLRGVGTFEIHLRPTTPRTVVRALDLDQGAFGSVIVTDVRVPVGNFSAFDLRAMARFHGILRDRPDDHTIEGAGAAVLLGDEDGHGPIVTTRLTWAGGTALNTIVEDLVDTGSNGIILGTVNTSGLATQAGEAQYVTIRQALDMFCDVAGAEWRVDPDLVLDVASPANLFANYTTPKILVSPHGNSRAANPWVIKPTVLRLSSEGSEWTSKVHYLARNGDVLNVGTATIGSNPYKAPGTADDLRMERVVDSSGAAGTSASTLATRELARFSATKRSLECRTAESNVARLTRPGDRAYVWDPDQNLYDPAVNAYLGGQQVKPMLVRVVGVTWGVQPGMGVYFIPPVGADEDASIIDLSDHVVHELGDSSLELAHGGAVVTGAPPNPGTGPFGSVALTAYDAWTSYAPTWTSSGTPPTIGNGAVSGAYRKEGRTVHFRVRVIAGSTTTFGTGTWIFTTPFDVLTGGAVGTHAILDSGVAWYHGNASVIVAVNTIYLGRATGFVSQGTPVTLGSGDSIYVEGTYEADS